MILSKQIFDLHIFHTAVTQFNSVYTLSNIKKFLQ